MSLSRSYPWPSVEGPINQTNEDSYLIIANQGCSCSHPDLKLVLGPQLPAIHACLKRPWCLWFCDFGCAYLYSVGQITMEKAETSQAWTKQHELSDSTVEVLKENGFDSAQSCELLNGSTIQKHFAMSLTLGHIRQEFYAVCFGVIFCDWS